MQLKLYLKLVLLNYLPLIDSSLVNQKNKSVIKELYKTQARLYLLSGDKLLINKSLEYLVKTTDPGVISVVNQFVEKNKNENNFKLEVSKAIELINEN